MMLMLQAVKNINRYGGILLEKAPKETTQFLKRLCTDYKPSVEQVTKSIFVGLIFTIKLFLILLPNFFDKIDVILIKVSLYAVFFNHKNFSFVFTFLTQLITAVCYFMPKIFSFMGGHCTSFLQFAMKIKI